MLALLSVTVVHGTDTITSWMQTAKLEFLTLVRFIFFRDRQHLTSSDLSDNFQKIYPALHAFLNKHPKKEPVCISLGTDGEYFARLKSSCSYNLSDKIKAHVRNLENIESL